MSDVTAWRKPNGKWEVRWRDHAGRRRGRTIDLKKDADRFATDIRRQQQGGDLSNPTAASCCSVTSSSTTGATTRSRNLAPKTLDVYGRVWEKHVRPRIGGVPLRQLSTPLLMRLRADLSRAGVGDPTVLKAFTMLQSVLSHAVVEGQLDHNPARAVRNRANDVRGRLAHSRLKRWSAYGRISCNA